MWSGRAPDRPQGVQNSKGVTRALVGRRPATGGTKGALRRAAAEPLCLIEAIDRQPAVVNISATGVVREAFCPKRMERILIPSTTTLSRTRGILDNFAVGKFIPIILCAQDCAIGQHDDDNEDLDLNAPLLVYNGTFSDDEDVPNDDDDLDEFDIAALRVPEPNQDDTYGPLHLGNYDTLDRTLLRDIGDAVKTTIKAGRAWRLPPEKTLRHLLGATEAYKFVGSGRRLQLHVKLYGNPGKKDWGYVGLFIGLDPRLTPDLKIQSKFRYFKSQDTSGRRRMRSLLKFLRLGLTTSMSTANQAPWLTLERPATMT